MRTVSLEDRVPMVLRTRRSMLEQYWSKTATGCLVDMVGASLTSAVPEDFLKMAETFEVPETGDV